MPTKPGRRPLSGYTIEEAAYHEAGHAVLARRAKPSFDGRRSNLAVLFVGG
jgi:hypothetical protein